MAETMDFVQFWLTIAGLAWLSYVDNSRWLSAAIVFLVAINGIAHGGIYG